MNHFKSLTLGLFIISMLLLHGCGDDEKDVNGPGQIANRVWIQDVTATADSQAKVDINLSNGVLITVASLPLRYFGSDCFVDSVSFVGSRFSDAMLKAAPIDTANQTIGLMVGDTIPFATGSGKVASIYFNLTSGSAGQTITIDSTTIDTDEMYQAWAFVAVGGIVFPQCDAGSITVEQ